MRLISTWPAPKVTLIERARELIDGRIYVFSTDDAVAWGVDVARFDSYGDQYREQRILEAVKSAVTNAVRKVIGPYQTRTMMRDGELYFQYTGLRDCRAKDCYQDAVAHAHGYCQGCADKEVSS